MKIIVVDDEALAMEHLARIVRQVRPEDEVFSFQKPSLALAYLECTEVDVAFLDIEMFGMNGIELARRCKEIQRDINIIFVTGHADYAVDAFALHASGYLLKPPSKDRVYEELAHLRVSPTPQGDKKLRVQTFGNFEVFSNGEPIGFARGKAKELFAYLIDRKGAGATPGEISAVLWEDKEYTLSLQKQFQTLVSEMMKALRTAKADDIIIRKRNYISVAVDKIDCDYYRFLEGDVRVINQYSGEYMSNYSWAEFTTGYLSRISQS